MRVLLIDDTPEIAELLAIALRDRGYDVAVSGFTAEIGPLVVRERATAAVFDCAAFEMSESLYDALRADPVHPDLPIVIVTDTPDAAVASLTGRQASRVLLVPKPFRGSDVVRALDQLLDGGPPAG